MDAAATIYSGQYSMNKGRHNGIIENLDAMVIDLLKAFRSKNNCLPELNSKSIIIKLVWYSGSCDNLHV
jgi:hypothetical protein